MTNEPKPKEPITPDGTSVDGEAVPKSDVENSSTPDGKKADKVVFNGREYASLAEAEADHKKLQTAYQETKAEKERLEAERAQKPEDDDFIKALFGESEPIPVPQVTPSPAPALQVDRDKIRVSLLLAERDPKKPYFKDVANDVAKTLANDPIIQAVAGIGQVDKAVTLAYQKAVAERIDILKAAEYKRGREETLRQEAKPILAPADNKELPPTPQKDVKDMTVEELEAYLPHAEPR